MRWRRPVGRAKMPAGMPGTSDERPSERELHRHRILATVDSIPRGRVASYGQIARLAGLPRRARLVGRVLSELPSGSELPWHRVVNAAGHISRRGDGRGEREQRRRLRAEGVVLLRGGRIDLRTHGWREE